jgi:hypothetical protein
MPLDVRGIVFPGNFLAGIESWDSMAQTGHKSETVVRGTIQDAGRGATTAVRAAFREDYPKENLDRPVVEVRRLWRAGMAPGRRTA